ncbi:MAG: DNRLRE domain-containing protein [bacterium]
MKRKIPKLILVMGLLWAFKGGWGEETNFVNPSPDKEIVEKRTLTSKSFDLGEGKILAKIGAGPIHYLEDGKWQDIDLKIESYSKSGYSYACLKNGLKTYLGRNGLIGVGDGQNTIFSLIPQSLTINDGNKKGISSLSESLSTNTICYKNEDIVLSLAVIPYGLRQEIALQAPSNITEYSFEFNLSPPYSFYIGEEKKDEFTTLKPAILSNGSESYIIYPPYAYEKERPENIIVCEYGIRKEDGKNILYIKMPQKWLTDSSRKYPVAIAQTILDIHIYDNIGDTHIYSASPNENFGGQRSILVYWENEVRARALIKFDLSSIPPYSRINSAELCCTLMKSAYEYSMNIYAHQITSNWREDTATWNNMSSNYNSSSEDCEYVSNTEDNKWWDVTSLVGKWVRGECNNYGIMLKGEESGDTNGKLFYSKENTVAKAPFLKVWYTPDATAPSSSVNSLSTYQTSASFPVSWSGSDDISGIKYYDVQYKDGQNGSWIDWKTNVTDTSASFSGANGHTYYFQCKAQDKAGNWEAYPDGNGDTYTIVDTQAPSSYVNSLPSTQESTVFTVSWSGSDNYSGLKHYDVQYKDGNGPWTDWKVQTTLTQDTFTGSDEHRYYFQCKAQDNAGNWEAYPGGNGDTYTNIKKRKSVINDFEVKEKGKEVASLGTSTLLGTSSILANLTILPGTEITISGKLKWDKSGSNEPLPNQTINIYFGGNPISAKTTGSNGGFSCDYLVPSNTSEGEYIAKAEFSGNEQYKGCSEQRIVKVEKRNSVINQFKIEPSEVMPGNSTIISGRLEWDKGGWFNDPIPNASIGLYIQNTFLETKPTNSDGRFSHSFIAPNQSGAHTIYARFPGDTLYKPSQIQGTLTVTLIANLSVSSSQFDPYSNKSLSISYYLYEPSKVTINITKDDKLVKTLISLADRPAGNQTEVWYGTIDKSGINPYDILIAPPGSYKIKVIAKPNSDLEADSKEIDNVVVK